MSEILEKAARLITDRLGEEGLPHSLRIEVTGEGSLFLGPSGLSLTEDAAADVTLRASPETFIALVKGETSAPAAFMKGKLSVEGDFATAMKLSGFLSR